MKYAAFVAIAVGYGVLAFFASLGVNHLWGLTVQAWMTPLFFVGGLVVGLVAVRAVLR